MSQKLLISLFLVLALASVQGGHIYSYDPDITFANVGYATTFTFYFSLESGLGLYDWIELTMPGGTTNLLGATIVPTVKLMSSGVAVGTGIFASGGSTTSTGTGVITSTIIAPAAVTAGITAQTSNVYYIQAGAALLANTWYTLTIVGSATLTSQGSSTTSILYDPVQLATCSSPLPSVSTARIYYDVNKVFSTFALAPTPSATTLLAVFRVAVDTVSTANSVLLGASYTFYLDITPKNGYNISTGAFYNIQLECAQQAVGGYAFTGTCANVACTTAPISCTSGNISLLTSSACTVVNTITTVGVAATTNPAAAAILQVTSSSLLFEYQPILADSVQFRIQGTFQNANYQLSSLSTCTLSVQEYSRANKKILYEIKTGIATVSQNLIAVTQTSIAYMWGLSNTYASGATITASCPVGLYVQKPVTVALNKLYNNVKLTFTLATATASGQNVILAVAMPGVIVVEGSIFSNVPVASGKKVICSSMALTTGVNSIVCRNIGALAIASYTISFRVAVISTQAAGTVLSAVTITIGAITLYADLLGYGLVIPLANAFTTNLLSTVTAGVAHTVASGNLIYNVEMMRTPTTSSAVTSYYPTPVAGASFNYAPRIYSVPAGTSLTAVLIAANVVQNVGGILMDTVGTNYLIFLMDVDVDVTCIGIANTIAPQNTGYTALGANPVGGASDATGAIGCGVVGTTTAGAAPTGQGYAIKLQIIMNPYAFVNPQTSLTTYTTAAVVSVGTASTGFWSPQYTLSSATNNIFVTATDSATSVPFIQVNVICTPQFNAKDGTCSQGFFLASVTTPTAFGMTIKQQTGIKPSITADTMALDFLMCFRRGPISAATATATGGAQYTYATYATAGTDFLLVSPSLYNAYLISLPVGSFIKFGFVNFFKDATTSNTGDKIPVVLRLLLSFSTADLSSATQLSVFFERSQDYVAVANGLDVTTYRITTLSPTAYPASAVTGTATANSYVYGTGTDLPYANNDDYASMTRVDVICTLAASTYNNIYIPVKQGTSVTALNEINSLHLGVGVIDANGFSSMSKVFRLFGPYLATTTTSAAVNFVSYLVTTLGTGALTGTNGGAYNTPISGTQTKLITPTPLAVGLTPYNSATATTGDMVFTLPVQTALFSGLLLTGGVTINAWVTQTTQNLGATSSFLNDISSIVPAGAAAAAATVVPAVQATVATAASVVGANNNVGAHYSVSSVGTDLWGTGLTFTWGHLNSAWASGCVKVSVGTGATAVYMIMCPYDLTPIGASGATTELLTVAPITVPSNYGISQCLYLTTTHAQSDKQGMLASIGTGLASYCPVASVCSVAATYPMWVITTNNQRVNFAVTIPRTVQIIQSTQTLIITATLFDGVSGTASTPASSSLTISSVCYQNNDVTLTCGGSFASNAMTFTLSATALKPIVTIAASTTIVLTALISHSSSTILATTNELTQKYGVQVSSNTQGNIIADCGFTTSTLRASFASGNTAAVQVITTPTYDYSLAKKAKYDFSFTFITAASKNVFSNEQFQFDIGFLQTPLSLYQSVTAVRCVVLNSLGVIDFNWLQFDMVTSSTSWQLYPKADVVAAVWRLKCYGGASPDSTNTNTALQSLKVGTSTVVQVSAAIAVPFTQNTNPTALSATNLLVVNVTQLSPGMDSDFYLTVMSTTTLYPAIGSRIYVQFPPSYQPRLNGDGQLACKHNNTPANCEFVSGFERFVRIYPVGDMIINNLQSIAILQVSQPNVLGTTYALNMYIALDTDSNLANGVIEHGEVALTAAGLVADSGNAIGAIYIMQYVQSSTVTRSFSDHTFQITIPAARVIAGNFFITQFFGQSEFYLISRSTLSCSLVRMSDSTAFGSTSCDILPGWKVRMMIATTDTTNSAAAINYQLTISGVPTPINALTNKWPLIIITDGVLATQKAKFRTTSTFQNSSTAPSFAAANNSGTILQWQNPIVNANKGYYDINSQASLYSASQTGKFYSTFTYSSISQNASSFLTVPTTLTATVGFAASTFLIAANQNTQLSAKYVIQYTRTVTDLLYTPIPPLRVNIVNNICTINAALSTYDVPSQGFSLPIVFDFTNCMPVNNIVYTANVTLFGNVSAAATSTLIQGLVTPVTAGVSTFQTLLGSQQNQTRLQFTVVNSDASAVTTPTASFAQVNVVVSGTDSIYFGTPLVIPINKVLKPTTIPNVLSATVLPQAGSAILSIRCDQTGVAYYAIAQNSSSLNIVNPMYNQSAIATASYAAGIQMTNPVQDLNWLIQGWLSIPTANSIFTATVQPVKSGANYSVIAWCTNLVNTVSATAGTNTWQQTSNGGVITQLAISFSQTLTRTQMQQFACGIVTYAQLLKIQVVTELGDGCNNASQRILQTTNTTANTTNTTANTTTTTTTTTSGSTQRFTVLPNYASASDTTSANVIATVTQANSAAILSAAQLSGITVSSITPTTYSTTLAFAAPVLATTSPQVVADSTHLNITLQLTSGDGYLYAAAVNYASSSLPTIAMLKAGTVFSTNSSAVTTVPVVAIANSFSAQNANTLLSIYSLTAGLSGTSTLSANTQYGIYFAATNADPSSNTLSTSVYRINGTTNANQNTFGSKMQISLFAFAVMIFALLF